MLRDNLLQWMFQIAVVACQLLVPPWFSEEPKTSERPEAQILSSARANHFETRSLPALARCHPRSFAFYVAYPIRSIHPCAFLFLTLRSELGELAAVVGRDELLVPRRRDQGPVAEIVAIDKGKDAVRARELPVARVEQLIDILLRDFFWGRHFVGGIVAERS